jgi:hypothetical protein
MEQNLSPQLSYKTLVNTPLLPIDPKDQDQYQYQKDDQGKLCHKKQSALMIQI